MKKDDAGAESGVPVRDEHKAPPCKKEVLDEILYRKVEKPTKVAHAGEILKFC
jgi:hypothetical protein